LLPAWSEGSEEAVGKLNDARSVDECHDLRKIPLAVCATTSEVEKTGSGLARMGIVHSPQVRSICVTD